MAIGILPKNLQNLTAGGSSKAPTASLSMGTRSTYPGAVTTPVTPKLTPAQTLPTLAKTNTSNLQGTDYFKNLAATGKPAEQQAAQNWLSRNGVGTIDTKKPELSTKPAVVAPPAPTNQSTRKQIIVNPDGSKTETHYNEATGNKVEGSTTTTTPTKVEGTSSTTASAPTVATPPTDTKAPVDTNPPVDNTYGGLINQLVSQAQPTQQELDLEAQRAKELAANQEQIAGVSMIGGDQSLATGRAGILQNLSAQKQAAYDSALSKMASRRQTSGSIFSSAAGMRAPTTLSGGSYQVDPVTGQPILGGSAESAATRGAVLGANVNSAAEATTKLNAINLNAPDLKANMEQAQNLANSGGLNNTAPILSQWQQRFGSTYLNNPTVSKFLTAIQAVNAKHSQITGDSTPVIDPQKVTTDQLKAVQQQIADNIQNTKASTEKYLSSSPKTSSSNTGGSVTWDQLLGN